MSMAIKAAKSGYRGDPGLFGFLGGIAKTALGAAGGLLTGGPIGAIAGGLSASGLLGSGARPVSVPLTMRATPMPPPILSSRPGVGLVAGGLGGVTPRLPVPIIPTMPIGQPFGSRSGAATPGGVTGPLVGTPSGAECTRGFHKNRTGYFTQRYGWVAPGTVCVRNRRRNPLNARALSRSLSRIQSAKSATEFLKRVSIRPRACAKCG